MNKSSYPRARKRFGQNFLQDQAVIDDIIAAIDPQQDQHIVEIGPGRGALTELLLANGAQLDLIELDRDLVALLTMQLLAYPQLTIHQADALRFDYRTLIKQQEKLRIVGNLPYNIATPLLFHLLDQAVCIEDMCFMLQREVVERICAQPGTKQYGRLSIMMQYQCYVEQLFIVPATAFYPIPKVESAILYLKPLPPSARQDVDSECLAKLLTQAFSQRRKTIGNTLKNIVPLSIIHQVGIELNQRPETISIDQYIALTKAWMKTQ